MNYKRTAIFVLTLTRDNKCTNKLLIVSKYITILIFGTLL